MIGSSLEYGKFGSFKFSYNLIQYFLSVSFHWPTRGICGCLDADGGLSKLLSFKNSSSATLETLPSLAPASLPFGVRSVWLTFLALEYWKLRVCPCISAPDSVSKSNPNSPVSNK